MKTITLFAICLSLTGCMFCTSWVSTVGFETAQKLCGESKVVMVENEGTYRDNKTAYTAYCANNAQITFTVKDR